MNDAVFRQIGPYAIDRPIGQGGMASVFLARDTRTDAVVALKLVHTGTDEESREILESEQRGAELQQRFSAVSQSVPHVFESGFAGEYFYIAMEFIEGEDLSQAIHRGPIPWERAAAIGIQLCDFLEEADRFEADAESRRVLLHNDLKPRNIRLTANGDVKVLDFGAAKALSMSRKVTRNDFGSTAYLSPECLESGDRDLHTDAWALGVLLYEMVSGHQPFRASDTRRLEQRIRSRRPPEEIGDGCPRAMDAVIAKLLAPYPDDRYDGPGDIRADLHRVVSGEPPIAQAQGWPERLHDEPPTRRTVPEQGQTVVRPGSDAGQTAIMRPTRMARLRRLARNSLLILVLALAMNEGCIAAKAARLANDVPMQDLAGLAAIWPKYESLAHHSAMGGWGVKRLENAFTSQAMVLAERVMANYRTPLPTVRENQWKAAREALYHAATLAPRDRVLRAELRYCDGQIDRINGEASKGRGQDTQAQQDFTDAVVAFRESASLRPDWPDPFLGLARTFIYGLDDVDRGADALAQAEKLGHHPSERETTQLADGYRARGEALTRTAQSLRGMAQERDYLSRAADAFREALTRYSSVAGFGDAGASIRDTQAKLDRVESRITDLSKSEGGWWPWR